MSSGSLVGALLASALSWDGTEAGAVGEGSVSPATCTAVSLAASNVSVALGSASRARGTDN